MGTDSGGAHAAPGRRRGVADRGRAVRSWVRGHRGRSGLVAGFCAGLAVALLVSVLAPFGADRDGLEDGELVILSGQDESATAQRQELISDWNATHPRNRARIEALSQSADGQHSEMVARAQSARPGVDIYNLDVTWTAEFARNGYLRPLDLPAAATADFLRKPLETCRYRGKLWALPFNTDAALLFYRKLPGIATGPPATWSQLTRLSADALDSRSRPAELTAGYTTQLDDYEGLTVNALEAIWDAGGEVVDRDGKVVIASDEAEEGLRRLVPSDPRLVLPASRQFKEEESYQAFRDGKVLFLRAWPVVYGTLAAARPGDGRPFAFGVARLPGPSVLGGQNLAVAAGSERPRAARALVEFLTDARSQQLLFERGGFAATREIVYRDREVTRRFPYAPVLLDSIREARLRPVTPHYPEFSAALRRVVRQALDAHGELPADATDTLTAALKGRER
jgi:multiple sugar transport system substrate-binding protein